MVHSLKTTLATVRSARSDRGFQQVLAALARTGTAVGGALGLVAVVVFVGTHVLLLDKALGWSYIEGSVVLWDKALLVGVCLVALALAPRVSLNGARLLTSLLVLVGSVASVTDDILMGSTAFSTGFVTFMYLLVVAVVPYRPGQTLALGVALTGAFYLTFRLFPPLAGVPATLEEQGHYIYLTIITVLLSGVSALLYSTRYGQYRARREAERLSEQVQDIEAAKSRFFTNVSHEVRTPLTLLLGPLEGALAGRYGPLEPRLHRRLQEMHAQARQLHGLVDQILDVSKLEAGAMPLRVREHDLAALARRQAELFRSAAERAGVALLVETPDAPLPVWFDAEKVGRVVSNLLANALGHTPPGGTVRVGVEAADGEALVSVRDSGEGIAPDALATVFDRFASGHQKPGGQASTGVGLALVKEIVERHGGRVGAASEPGFSAEFTVRLPLGSTHVAPEDLAGPEDSAESDLLPAERADPLGLVPGFVVSGDGSDDAAPEPPEDAPLVLVVDDNEPVRAYLRDLLGGDYRVLEAADGAEAWAAVEEHRPALVVSDVMMPGLDGFDLCRQIRGDDRLAATPVVLLTARAEEEARLEGWKTGADAYLAKPFSGEELVAIAEHLIGVRRLLRERVAVPDWMESKDAAVRSPDAEFLDRVQQAVGAHIGDSSFGVEWLAEEVGLSARQLQRRLKKLTRLTAAGFVKAMRLEHAARLLRQRDVQVQEVARAVGYEDASYFSRLFRQAYGVPPSEYGTDGT